MKTIGLVKVILLNLLTFFNKNQWVCNNQTPNGFAVTELNPEFIYCVNAALRVFHKLLSVAVTCPHAAAEEMR